MATEVPASEGKRLKDMKNESGEGKNYHERQRASKDGLNRTSPPSEPAAKRKMDRETLRLR